MGIQYLNSYIKKNTNNGSIIKQNLSELYGKTIVVDTSIYLYRFLVDQGLIDNMYMMISLFKYYNITPLFIFDGKAPIEKNKLLEKRNNDKIIAEKKYNDIKNELKNTEQHSNHYEELYNEMTLLKKKIY